MLRDAFARHGLRYMVFPWTSASKPAAVERLRRWLADGLLANPEHTKLRREMLSFEEKVTPSGQFTFAARGRAHDDYVALLLTTAMAEIAGHLPGSPLFEGARQAREARDLQLHAQLALVGGPAFAPWAKDALALPPGMSPQKEREVLEALAGGSDLDTSLLSPRHRISLASAKHREANIAAGRPPSGLSASDAAAWDERLEKGDPDVL